jgi:hypothetical protein
MDCLHPSAARACAGTNWVDNRVVRTDSYVALVTNLSGDGDDFNDPIRDLRDMFAE